MFTALADNIDDITEKINVFVALAPITYVGGEHNELLKAFSVSIPVITNLLSTMNLFEIFGPDWE